MLTPSQVIERVKKLRDLLETRGENLPLSDPTGMIRSRTEEILENAEMLATSNRPDAAAMGLSHASGMLNVLGIFSAPDGAELYAGVGGCPWLAS